MMTALRWLVVTAALGWSAALLWGRWWAEIGPGGALGAAVVATTSVAVVWLLAVWYTVDTVLRVAERALAAGARTGGRLIDHVRSEGGRWVGGGVEWFVAAARDGLAERDAPPWVRGALPVVAVWTAPLLADGVVVGADVAEAELSRRLLRWSRRVTLMRRLLGTPALLAAYGLPLGGLAWRHLPALLSP
jgi:hypothetical protein